MNVARIVTSAAIMTVLAVDLAAAKPATVAAEVNLRKAPGTDSEVITLIPKGTMVEVGTCTNGWWAASLGTGRDGFFHRHQPRPGRPCAGAPSPDDGRRLRLSAAARHVWTAATRLRGRAAGLLRRAGLLWSVLWTLLWRRLAGRLGRAAPLVSPRTGTRTANCKDGNTTMLDRCRAGALALGVSALGVPALAAILGIGIVGARADDTAKYPDLNGQWSRASAGAQWDPTRAGRPAATGAADRRVSGHFRVQSQGAGRRRRGLQSAFPLHPRRHAPHDAGL